MSAPQQPWTVYMLRCADDTIYTGIARDAAKRLAAHNSGKGAKYTRARRPVAMIYSEAAPDRSEASRREYAIKRMTRRAKLALIG